MTKGEVGPFILVLPANIRAWEEEKGFLHNYLVGFQQKKKKKKKKNGGGNK